MAQVSATFDQNKHSVTVYYIRLCILIQMETNDEMGGPSDPRDDVKPDARGDHLEVLGNGDPDAMGNDREVIEDSRPDAIGGDPDENYELNPSREFPGEVDEIPVSSGQDLGEVDENVENTHEVGTDDKSERFDLIIYNNISD